MTSTTTTKRHRWPKHDRPGECRNGDKCLDCGADLNEAKRGGVPCEPHGTMVSSTDLGNGWIRQDKCFVWAGEPITAHGETFRDLMRFGYWHVKDVPVLRIETGDLGDGDPADPEDVHDAVTFPLGSAIDLPITALPELAYILARVLTGHGLWLSLLDRLASEQEAELARLIKAAGGNMNATVAEAEAAAKAQGI